MTRDEDGLTDLPRGWIWLKVEDAIQKVSLTGRKLKKRDYQEGGRLPVVDQGQSPIGGYTDRQDLVVACESPVIVFGDHTRAFKYVDFQFVAGADGVQVLQPAQMFYPKLFYYFLQAIQFPDKGYARHYQFLRKSLVPLPPRPEQQRIVAKIEELFTQLDAGVAALEKARVQLKRYRQAVLRAAMEGDLTREWREARKGELEPASVLLARILEQRRAKWEADQLETMRAKGKVPKNDKWKKKYKEPAPLDMTGLPELPCGWVWTTFERIGANQQHSIVDGPFGSNLKLSDYIEDTNGVPVLTTKNLEYGYGTDQLRYISYEKFEQLRRSEVKGGDIVVAKIGSCGKTAIYPHGMRSAIIPANLMKITVHSELERLFVLHYLNSPFFGTQLQRIIRATAQPAFSVSRFRQLPLPLPSLAEQRHIVAEIEQRFSVAEQIEKTVDQDLARSSRLRQSILRNAFEGKLVPQDPADGPASVLLERIKAEKANCETEMKSRKRKPRKDEPQQLELI